MENIFRSLLFIQNQIGLDRYASYNSLLHMLCLSINNYTKLLSYFYHVYYTLIYFLYTSMENTIIVSPQIGE